MKRMSLQWRLTCITTLCIAIICGCLTMFVYKNGVHYIDSLQDAVESQGDEKGNKSDEIYISIPDDKWDEFADEFSFQVYNNKADYKRNSLIITVLLALSAQCKFSDCTHSNEPKCAVQDAISTGLLSRERFESYLKLKKEARYEFADEFSFQVYNNKADYKRNSLIITVLLALLGGVVTYFISGHALRPIVTYFISGHALRPIREFSDKIEEVQAQNLSDSRIEENNVKELNQLGISYNKMLERLSEAFEIQRQFTANAAHELRTPLALMQVQLDLYNSASHPGNDADTLQTIKMVTEQNDKLNRMVKTLLDMSELQTVGRDDKIILDAIVEEVLADLEPLAVEKNIKLIGKCEDATMIKMVTEQNDKLNRMVKTLLDMSELQTVGRDDKIILDAIVEEVLADLEPLAVEKNIKLIGKCEDATMIGSDILIYRLVYNLVENAIKYNHPLGQVTVTLYTIWLRMPSNIIIRSDRLQ